MVCRRFASQWRGFGARWLIKSESKVSTCTIVDIRTNDFVAASQWQHEDVAHLPLERGYPARPTLSAGWSSMLPRHLLEG